MSFLEEQIKEFDNVNRVINEKSNKKESLKDFEKLVAINSDYIDVVIRDTIEIAQNRTEEYREKLIKNEKKIKALECQIQELKKKSKKEQQLRQEDWSCKVFQDRLHSVQKKHQNYIKDLKEKYRKSILKAINQLSKDI